MNYILHEDSEYSILRLRLISNAINNINEMSDNVTKDEDSITDQLKIYDNYLSGSNNSTSDNYNIEDKMENYSRINVKLADQDQLKAIIDKMKNINLVKNDYDGLTNLLKNEGDKLIAKIKAQNEENIKGAIKEFTDNLTNVKGIYDNIFTAKQELDAQKKGLGNANENYKNSDSKDQQAKQGALSSINSEINAYNTKVKDYNDKVVDYIKGLNDSITVVINKDELNIRGKKAFITSTKRLYGLAKFENSLKADNNGGYTENNEAETLSKQNKPIDTTKVEEQLDKSINVKAESSFININSSRYKNLLLEDVNASLGDSGNTTVTSNIKNWDDEFNACKSAIDAALHKANAFKINDNKSKFISEAVSHTNKAAQSVVSVFVNKINANVNAFKELVELYNKQVATQQLNRANELDTTTDKIAEKGNPAVTNP